MSETALETTGFVVASNVPIRILHVDDDDAFLKVAKQCLELNVDIQVETTRSVEEALKMLKKRTFDVIVSDYVMFEKDGLEFLRELRASGNMVPFILFTGKGGEDVVLKAFNLGAFKYINKNGAPNAVYKGLAACVRQAAELAKSHETLVKAVVDQKKQEKMLQESQQKLLALFCGNPGAVVFLDKDFRITDINHSFTALFGHKLENIKGKIIADVVVPKGLEEELEVIREKILEGSVGCATIRKRNDGSLFNASMSGGPITVNGEVAGFFMVYMDISDVVTVQDELSKALSKVELLSEKIDVMNRFNRQDVKNKLALVQGNLCLAREKCKVSPELEIYLRNAEDIITNITNLLDFAKTEK